MLAPLGSKPTIILPADYRPDNGYVQVDDLAEMPEDSASADNEYPV